MGQRLDGSDHGEAGTGATLAADVDDDGRPITRTATSQLLNLDLGFLCFVFVCITTFTITFILAACRQ